MKTTTGPALQGAHPPIISAGQGTIAPNKWSLLQLIEDIREPLGLRGTSISLLRAMISFVRGDRITAEREDGHICFASNASLAKRTHVSVQTVERHIAKLVTLGLLSRQSSANGKRWARRDASGRVVLATGLSLLPIVNRQAEFLTLNQEHKAKISDLSLLKDKCRIALAQLKPYLGAKPGFEPLFTTARNTLRRRLSKAALTDLLERIHAKIQEVASNPTGKMRGNDHENEGHKEPSMNPLVKEKEDYRIDVNPAEMERAYPRLCAELRTARSQRECEHRMGDIAQHLNLGGIWFDIRKLGPARAFMMLGYLLERIDKIKNPRGYATHFLRGLNSGAIDWTSLLNKPVRRGAGGHLHAQCT